MPAHDSQSTGKLPNLSKVSRAACMSYMYLVGVGWFCVVLFEGKSPLKKCLNFDGLFGLENIGQHLYEASNKNF